MLISLNGSVELESRGLTRALCDISMGRPSFNAVYYSYISKFINFIEVLKRRSPCGNNRNLTKSKRMVGSNVVILSSRSRPLHSHSTSNQSHIFPHTPSLPAPTKPQQQPSSSPAARSTTPPSSHHTPSPYSPTSSSANPPSSIPPSFPP